MSKAPVATIATIPAHAGFDLTIEPACAILPADEHALVRDALARAPGSALLRRRLADLLYGQDAFDAAVALLEPLAAEAPDADVLATLAYCLLARETSEDTARAADAVERALALTIDPVERGALLATLGKVRVRQGRPDEARAALAAALAANPADRDAYKRLVALELAAQRPHAVLALADGLSAQDVGHSRLLASRVLALAALGQSAGARDALGLGHFLECRTLQVPAGWPTIEAFNRDLAAELRDHPALRFDRYGTASMATWRIDQPASARSRLVPMLQRQIHAAVADYVSRLPDGDHPWLAARPAGALLHGWCVLTDGPGFEEWHVHQHGWLSGVYYAAVPDAVATGTGREGCLAFGLPPDIVGPDQAAAFGDRLVRPYEGLLVLFPSHAYHRTFAHRSDRRRICFAFDIRPAD